MASVVNNSGYEGFISRNRDQLLLEVQFQEKDNGSNFLDAIQTTPVDASFFDLKTLKVALICSSQEDVNKVKEIAQKNFGSIIEKK